MTKLSRRGLLAALGAIGLAGTAGCNAFSNESTTDAPTDTAAGTDRGSTTPTATLSPGTTDSAASGETSKTVTGSRSTASGGTKTATQTPSPTPAPTETPTPTPTPTPTGPWRFAADDSDGGDNFGGAVALSGDTALVGAKLDRDPNGGQAGSAYVFTRSGGVWTQGAKLVPEDGDGGDSFGASVALSGDTAVVGAWQDEDPNGDGAGSAYVFTRSDGAWRQQEKLAPEDGAANDWFGAAVALAGDTALVGAHGTDHRGTNTGSTYAFGRTDDGWTLRTTLDTDSVNRQDRFGASVALTGETKTGAETETALVGAPQEENAEGRNAGAAHVFSLS